MARRRRREAPPEAGLRAAMLAHYRELAERAARVAAVDWWYPGADHPGRNPYTADVAALEAGDPLLVVGWALARWVAGLDPWKHYTVEPDGTVTPMRTIRHGNVVEFIPEEDA